MTKIRNFTAIIILAIFTVSGKANAQKASNDAVKIGKMTFPYNFRYEENLLSPMYSATDPDVQVWDGVVWVYCGQTELWIQ
jgi:glycosylphosphatidylinositol transamidase (GPIT) subunit GPI8